MASSQFPFCDHHPQKSVRHCNGPAILTTEKEPGVECQTRLAWICKGCLHGSCQDSKTQVPSIYQSTSVISQAITLDSNLYRSLMSVLIWINGYLSPYLEASHVTLPSHVLISPEKVTVCSSIVPTQDTHTHHATIHGWFHTLDVDSKAGYGVYRM